MIKKRDYNKALKIVKAYEQQLNKPAVIASLFGFLWFNENNTEHSRYIKAKNINSACKKFLANKPKTMVRIDYEVQHGNEYIDISNLSEFKDWL